MKTKIQFPILASLIITVFLSWSFTTKTQSESDWTLLKSTTEANVFGKTTTCDGLEVYLFKVENRTNELKKFSLNIELPNEKSYGPRQFEMQVAELNTTTESCEEAQLKLPCSFNNSLTQENVKIKITSK